MSPGAAVAFTTAFLSCSVSRHQLCNISELSITLLTQSSNLAVLVWSRNHKACIERFDNIESAAVYIFEIGITGDPQFKYISRGSVDVYGLTPEEVTHPEGCQRILAVIHVEDQAPGLHVAAV